MDRATSSNQTMNLPLPEIQPMSSQAPLETPDFAPVVPCSTRTFRTAHIVRKLDPAEWGGTETAIQRLFEGLYRRHVETVLFCPRLQPPPAPEPLARDGCTVKRFRSFLPIWGLPAERRRQLIAIGGNLMSFDLPLRLWQEPDLSLIHTHVLGRLGGIAATVARARRLPLVVTIHGGYLDLPPALRK